MNGKLKLINSPFKLKSNKTLKTSRLIITLLAVLFFANRTTAQDEEVYYYPKLPHVEMSEAKTTLARILKETGNINHPNLIHIKDFGNPKDVFISEDRIDLKINPQNTSIYFSDLPNYDIKIFQKKRPAKDNFPTYLSYEIMLGELIFWTTNREESSKSLESIQLNLKILADYLFYFQHQANIKRYDAQLIQFNPIAAKYRELKVKPPVSEEQRKYIVQANLLNQQKMYDKAIELYKKAIELDQTAYPAGYSNLALLSAQINRFDAAIYHMKKYLLLEPEASDARNAQDKIYEWELSIDK